MENFPMLNYHRQRHQCSAGGVWHVGLEAWWFGIPPDDGTPREETRGHLFAVFEMIEILLLRRCVFFFAKTNVEFCWVIIGEGPLIFSYRKYWLKRKICRASISCLEDHLLFQVDEVVQRESRKNHVRKSMSGVSEVLVFSFKNLQCSSHPNLRISWFWWNLELNHRRENPSISALRAYGICSDLTWTIHTTRSHHHQLIGIGAIEIGTANWWPFQKITDQSSMICNGTTSATCCMLKLVEMLGWQRNYHSNMQWCSSNHKSSAWPKKRWKKKRFLTTKLGTKVTLRWLHLSSCGLDRNRGFLK